MLLLNSGEVFVLLSIFFDEGIVGLLLLSK